MATAKVRAWQRSGKPFWFVHAVSGPGWHRGREGTEAEPKVVFERIERKAAYLVDLRIKTTMEMPL